MRRSRTYPATPHAQNEALENNTNNNNSNLVRSIASFLSLGESSSVSPTDSWAVGVELDQDNTSWSLSGNSVPSPLTPALMVVSPGATPEIPVPVSPHSDTNMQRLLEQRKRKYAQEKITQAVFNNPMPLRDFCWEAWRAANGIRQSKELPELHIEPPNVHLIQLLGDLLFHNVPLTVFLDVVEATGGTTIDTGGATITISIAGLSLAASTIGTITSKVCDTTIYCVTNPFRVLEAIINLQFNAMGKTSEVLVSGIQSVATGVGSASSLALHKISVGTNMSSSASLGSYLHTRNNRQSVGTFHSGDGTALNQKLLCKLAEINDAALVVDYREKLDDGLTRSAVSRTRRMMHYSVSLKPFVATVVNPRTNVEAVSRPYQDPELANVEPFPDSPDGRGSPTSSDEEDSSPFMCTPQSFPPTPHSRRMVIHQRSQLSDDVVFLARDRLRVKGGLMSEDVLTRERSQALEDNKRLAVLECDDSGIQLTCGRHCATKVPGNVYYASARSMVSVLRNCFVYYEFLILDMPGPRPGQAPPPVATLSIGLSTNEMPPNTLVGAWQGSVGLCTTGQILMAGQWFSPPDPAMYAYGYGATVGCLVYLDDDSAFETWDGVMLRATVRFNVNGVLVAPPVSTLPGAPDSLPTSTQMPTRAPTELNSNSMAKSESLSPASLSHSPPDRLEPPPPTLSLLVPSTLELFPTVTLQSTQTSVLSLFSFADIKASTRSIIGAPPGVVVYGLDGSVILSETDMTKKTKGPTLEFPKK